MTTRIITCNRPGRVRRISSALQATALLAFTSIISAGCASTRAGYDEPPHTATVKDGKYQVRQYEDMKMVLTATGTRSQRNNGFRRLFNYITGANDRSAKIAMTVPVVMTGTDQTEMAFVLPADTDVAPTPTNQLVELREVSWTRVAVLRFSGSTKPKRCTEMQEKLKQWILEKRLSATGEVMVAVYDPPWTPNFMARNEIIMPLK
jgi:hypothetical protein